METIKKFVCFQETFSNNFEWHTIVDTGEVKVMTVFLNTINKKLNYKAVLNN